MRAFALESFDAPPALRDDLPAPPPGDREVLVRVHASSVNAVDRSIAAGMLNTALVVGASGGVGSLAVQLAAHAGATVIGPGLPEDEAYLSGLGVTEMLDRDADVAAAVRESHPDGVDALLDLVSYAPEGFDAHAAALKEGGRGATPLGAAGEGPGRANVMGVPSPENLERVARLLDDGTLRVPLQASFRLDQAGEALEAFSARHTQGKVGIAVG